MPLERENVVKPSKWKGTPEMREVAAGECWEDFYGLLETLTGDADGVSAEELAVFHASWYMRVGHANLGRMYVALAKAMVAERAA